MASSKTILKTFGQNLRRIREEKELSLRQLSALSGIDNADLSRMERGMVNVTLNTVVQLAEALEVPYLKLLKTE